MTHPEAARKLALKLKCIPLKWEIISLGAMFLFFPYAIYALQLFPNGDCYFNFIHIYFYAISSLLNGAIPYWDPMAACGSPFFLSFLPAGMLEPCFAIAVLIGKLISLNILQIYMLWIVLRTLPFLIGMFWLLKQLCRHSALVLFSTAFIYLTMAFSLLNDGVFFAVYWPLLLALLTYLFQSLDKKKFPIAFFYGSIFIFSISLMCGNSAFTLVFISTIILFKLIFAFNKSREQIKKLYLRIGSVHGIIGLILLLGLLSPVIAIAHNYQQGDYFAYLRVHHHQQQLSHFTEDPLDYIAIAMDNSPMRRGKELSTILFPFFYHIRWYADGTLYFGFLGVLGILAAIFFRRSKIFLIYAFSAFFTVFFMTWSANESILLMRPFLPFLKILNQRQLLFPAFLIFATVAGCLGLRLMMSYPLLKIITKHLTLGKIFITGTALILVTSLYVFVTSLIPSEYQLLTTKEMISCDILFIGAFVGIIWMARAAGKNPKLFTVYLSLLFIVYLTDANNYFRFLLKGCIKNAGVLVHSRMLREKLDLKYAPYRSPILPGNYGSGPSLSIVHQLNLRSALPSYWDCDILFSTRRFYDFFSLLEPEKLKPMLAITSPMVRLFPKSSTVENPDDAMTTLRHLSLEEAQNTIVVNKRAAPDHLSSKQQIIARAFTGPPIPLKIFYAQWPKSGHIEETFYFQLYDRFLTIPPKNFEEVGQGIFHKRLFRIIFPDEFKVKFDNTTDLLSRYFFPDFPVVTDVDGAPRFVSFDRNSMLQFIPDQGFLVETSSLQPLFPSKLYVLEARPVAQKDVEVVGFGPNHIAIQTHSEKAAVLEYADLYDSNWQATIDERPAEILIANHAFKAVNVPKGNHQVIFYYRVPFLAVGLGIYYFIVTCFLAGMIGYFMKNAGFYRIFTATKTFPVRSDK